MCRQVVGNKKGYMTIDKEYGGLEHYLSWLIFERGGSGNGINAPRADDQRDPERRA